MVSSYQIRSRNSKIIGSVKKRELKNGQMQIAEFILTAEQGSDLGKRRRSDYKEGKAFSYLDSQWLKEVFYHPISDTHELCLLKSQSTPSQRIGNVPHKIWVCVKKINGTVEAAYCTCFAG